MDGGERTDRFGQILRALGAVMVLDGMVLYFLAGRLGTVPEIRTEMLEEIRGLCCFIWVSGLAEMAGSFVFREN